MHALYCEIWYISCVKVHRMLLTDLLLQVSCMYFKGQSR